MGRVIEFPRAAKTQAPGNGDMAAGAAFRTIPPAIRGSYLVMLSVFAIMVLTDRSSKHASLGEATNDGTTYVCDRCSV
jgi:hypothetical protein